jgi:DNA-directed RNA polymerase subunit RPC12/RpoP
MAGSVVAPEQKPAEAIPAAASTRAVHLWTDLEFKKARAQTVKTELIITGIGLLLMVIGGLSFGQNWGGWGTVLGIIFLLGVYMAVGRWLQKLVKPSVSFEDWRHAASKQEDWYREVPCPACGGKARANIGFYEYACAGCKAPLTMRAGLTPKNVLTGAPMPTGDSLETVFHQGQACPKCKVLNPLAERPGWLTCPHCQARIELAQIPL